jgi:hypothetical protein
VICRGIKKYISPAILALVFCGLTHCLAYGESSVEYDIKASLILKFTSFVQWPDNNSTVPSPNNLVLCISGKNNFGDIFDLAQEENILDRKLTVKRLGNSSNFKSCHILFVSTSNKKRMRTVLNQVKTLGILVISEGEGFSELGAGINFLTVNNKVRFEINKRAINKSGLKISSELLNLAYRVIEDN